MDCTVSVDLYSVYEVECRMLNIDDGKGGAIDVIFSYTWALSGSFTIRYMYSRGFANNRLKDALRLKMYIIIGSNPILMRVNARQ